MQNLCQTNMQCLYHGSGSEGTPIVAFLPFDIKGIKSCLWLYLASRGILGAQSNNYWQKTERVSLRRNSRRNTYRSWLNLQLVWREVSGVRSGDDAAISHFPVKFFIEVVFSWKLKKHAFFSETFGDFWLTLVLWSRRFIGSIPFSFFVLWQNIDATKHDPHNFQGFLAMEVSKHPSVTAGIGHFGRKVRIVPCNKTLSTCRRT